MLKIKNLKKSFLKNQVLKGVDLELKKGEILSILGSSGGGKSTLLRIIAALEKADSYEEFHSKGKVAMMFQNYALFPHLNVAQNILFALYDFSKKEKEEKLNTLLKNFDISNIKEKMVDEISGGQAQRVAFARAIARGCDVLLLDEPFSNLDQNLKSDLRVQLKNLIKTQGISAIMVTHDIEDAYALSDKIALLDDGVIVECVDASRLFFTQNKKVAKFLPHLNIVERELDLKDSFFAWIASQNFIFSFTSFTSGTDYEADVLESEFLGAFNKLKVCYKGLEFSMLISSKYKVGAKISFNVIEG